jgi:hypothetical protein
MKISSANDQPFYQRITELLNIVSIHPNRITDIICYFCSIGETIRETKILPIEVFIGIPSVKITVKLLTNITSATRDFLIIRFHQ